MPRYFFDLNDGDDLLRDAEGSEHADLLAARMEAAETLSQIGRDLFRSELDRAIVIEIRNEQDGVIMRVRLHFSAQDVRKPV